MGITGGLACHLFSYLIGFGASSILTILKGHNQKINFIEFDIFSSKFIKENKITLLALFVIMIN